MKKIIIIGLIFLFFSSGILSMSIHSKSIKYHSQVRSLSDIYLDNDQRTTECWALLVAPPDESTNYPNINNVFVCELKNFKELLISNGWQEDHIKTYFYEEATKTNLLNGIKWLSENAEPADTVLIFLNDHGSEGKYWLYPYDKFITYQRLNFEINKIKSQSMGIIVNACYSGSAIPYLEKEGRVITTTLPPDCYGTSGYPDLINGFLDVTDINPDFGNNNGVTSLEECNNLVTNWYPWKPVYDGYDGDLNIMFSDLNNGCIDQFTNQNNIVLYRMGIGYNYVLHNNIKEWYNKMAAQSFIPEKDIITQVKLYMGISLDEEGQAINVSIRKDLNGTDLTKTTYYPDPLTYAYLPNGYFTFDFPDIQVTPGETYYIVIESSIREKEGFRSGLNIIFGKTDLYDKGELNFSRDDGETWYTYEPGENIKFVTYGYNIDDNSKPHTPRRPYGPVEFKKNTEQTFFVKTTDAENDDIYYKMDYGDGTESEWVGPVNSGDIVGFNCSWDKGTYKIRVKAKDIHGDEGEWSDTLGINVKTKFSKNGKQLNLMEKILDNFPIISQILQQILNH